MLRSIRFLLVTLVLALSAFLGASPVAAQTALPPSLQGEQFFAFETPFAAQGTIDVSGACSSEAGETFTLTYTASGVATGPYPGTFTETGTVTATLTTPGTTSGTAGVVVTWTADFTIDSPAALTGPATVTGTKTLRRSLEAACVDVAGFAEAESAQADLFYEAKIKTPTGTYSDQGQAVASVSNVIRATGSRPDGDESFFELFYVSTGVLPLDTSGKATGGGQILSGSNPLERVTFGFNVKKDEDETRLKGNCNVIDHATGTHVKCLTVTDYQQIGNTATWEGTAEVNGDREHYRITVQDNGEPNQGIDMFSIVTDTYDAAGNVQHGNVQLHKQQLGL